MTHISGWDIGGAHIKVARCDQHGNNMHVIQVPCPLWKGLEYLQKAIKSVFTILDNQYDLTAVTMTGELVDIFAHRQQGVADILDCLAGFVSSENIHVYGAEAGWLSICQAKKQWQNVASRNWQASANLAANYQHNGLFIDLGSTTCDIIALHNGQAQPQGLTDFDRQISRELLYTGAIRTPLISLCQSAPFNGTLVGLAAEVFATTGDCWCLLGKLSPESIQDASADGKSWQAEHCAARLAHLLGTDANQAELGQWRQLAQWFAQQQCHLVINAILQVMSLHKEQQNNYPIIGAGIGRFIVKMCAEQLQQPYQNFHQLLATPKSEVSDHAPAAAIALLAHRQLT